MNAPVKDNKRRELIFRLAFFVAATVVTLILGEIAVRIVSSVHLVYNIEMVNYAKQLKMRDPSGQTSHVHRPSSCAHLMGVDVALNSLGDRGPELKYPKSRHSRSVLVLGSSITMGWGVPFEKTFTSDAQEMLNSKRPFGPNYTFEFINAGIGNYNTHFQYKLFQRQYPLVKPDMVVLHYFISDVEPRSMGRDSLILRESFLAAFLFDRWSQMKLRISGKYKDLFTFYKDFYSDDSQPWKQTRDEISAMRDATAKDGVPFLVMIIPDIHDLSPGTPYKDLYAKIETAFKAMNIPTTNTFDAFQKSFGDDASKVWIQSDDPHPNAKGHQLMADVFCDYFAQNDPMKINPAAPKSPR